MSDAYLVQATEERRRYREGIGPFEDFFGNAITGTDVGTFRPLEPDTNWLAEERYAMGRYYLAHRQHQSALFGGDTPEANRQEIAMLDSLAEIFSVKARLAATFLEKLRIATDFAPGVVESLLRPVVESIIKPEIEAIAAAMQGGYR
jgi:hypothetical protein